MVQKIENKRKQQEVNKFHNYLNTLKRFLKSNNSKLTKIENLGNSLKLTIHTKDKNNSENIKNYVNFLFDNVEIEIYENKEDLNYFVIDKGTEWLFKELNKKYSSLNELLEEIADEIYFSFSTAEVIVSARTYIEDKEYFDEEGEKNLNSEFVEELVIKIKSPEEDNNVNLSYWEEIFSRRAPVRISFSLI